MNKHRTAATVLIQGRRLLTFRPHVQRLIEGGAYSEAALIQVNTVVSVFIVIVISFVIRPSCILLLFGTIIQLNGIDIHNLNYLLDNSIMFEGHKRKW